MAFQGPGQFALEPPASISMSTGVETAGLASVSLPTSSCFQPAGASLRLADVWAKELLGAPPTGYVLSVCLTFI